MLSFFGHCPAWKTQTGSFWWGGPLTVPGSMSSPFQISPTFANRGRLSLDWQRTEELLYTSAAEPLRLLWMGHLSPETTSRFWAPVLAADDSSCPKTTPRLARVTSLSLAKDCGKAPSLRIPILSAG